MKIYTGTLSTSKMSPLVKRAYHIINNQKDRCKNPNTPNYKWYGAEGIRVEYSNREFIGWYLDQMKKKKIKRPNVSRIDHSKNYSLDNIELLEAEDNTRERLYRRGNPGELRKKKVYCYNKCNGNLEFVFESTREAARQLLIGQGNIPFVMNKPTRSLLGLLFRDKKI